MNARLERFDDHDVWAQLNAETFDPIAERITKLVSHGRRMVVIRRYINPRGKDELDIKVGQQLADDAITVSKSTFPEPTWHFDMALRSGSVTDRFGFSAPESLTPAGARRLWDTRESANNKDAHQFYLRGRGNEPHPDDLIELERWNVNGVGELITIAFQYDGRN